MGFKRNKTCSEMWYVNFISAFLLVYIIGSFLEINALGNHKVSHSETC